MLNGWRTTLYFAMRGIGYGVALGGLAGSFVFPVVGTFYGVFWGGAAGVVLGVVLGLAAHFYNRHAYQNQLDFEEYQSNLTMGAGLAAAVLSAIPLLVIFAPIAAIASAYVAHRYAEDNAQHIAKRKNEHRIPQQTHMEQEGVISMFVSLMFTRSRWVYGLGVVAAMVLAAVGYLADPFALGGIFGAIGAGVAGGLLALAGGAFVLGIIGLANGVMIQFLNRLVFRRSMEKATYKRAVVAFSAIFTMLISPMVTLFFGLPVAGLLAAWAAAGYADWYYESQPKRKRAGQHQLEEHYEDPDEFFYEDDDEAFSRDDEYRRR